MPVQKATGALPFWAEVGPERLEHIRRVAALLEHWARAMRLGAEERARWQRAAWLHDALRDAPTDQLERWAGTAREPIELLHGPAAAARAEAAGEHDQGVLDAIRYHSLGYPGWDRVGRALYAADFLEPGRRFDVHARRELATRFPVAPGEVLRDVARRRRAWVERSGWLVPEETLLFWSALDAGDAW